MDNSPTAAIDVSSSPDVFFASLPKRRKLKHPRTMTACKFCRRRKVRCSGTQPCEQCNSEGIPCEYENGRPPSVASEPRVQSHLRISTAPQGQPALNTERAPKARPEDYRSGTTVTSRRHGLPDNSSADATPRASRRASLEPPQAMCEGQQVGPTAGIAFLYHGPVYEDAHRSSNEVTLPSASLISYGDLPTPPFNMDEPLPHHTESSALLDRYFSFATPTYRFLSRPMLEKWSSQFLANEKISASRAACVLIVWAQAILYNIGQDEDPDRKNMELGRSRAYSERAKALLNRELGPASIVSVQARLAMCLNLLSTFRINECQHVFGLTITLLTCLGLHRKTSRSNESELLMLELRKRTLWSAYILDRYLSVMLGRPRLLHDQDIDQPYPLNLDDYDLLAADSIDGLPPHGQLEAFIAHANITKLMGRSSDMLYPLEGLKRTQIHERAEIMLRELRQYIGDLPAYLKPQTKTLAGQRTFQRQNTVVKLAESHLRILITRQCILVDFRGLGRRESLTIEPRARVLLTECASAIRGVIDTAIVLIKRQALIQGFWYTQYISLVAVSTLYVFAIQQKRAAISRSSFADIDTYLDLAEVVYNHLVDLSPEGSPPRRHLARLEILKKRAQSDNSAAKQRSTEQAVMTTPSDEPWDNPQLHSVQEDTAHSSTPNMSPQNLDSNLPAATSASLASQDWDPIFEQASSDGDSGFQTLLNWSWEELDSFGFPFSEDTTELGIV